MRQCPQCDQKYNTEWAMQVECNVAECYPKLDVNLNQHALRPNKQYWNNCLKKAKIQIFDRKLKPNVFK
jgi:hypothetical protein